MVRLDRERDLLTWFFRHANGEWWSDWSYVWSGFFDAGNIPGFIYTRRPRASQRALVRPIVRLFFDREKVCTNSSAEFAMQYPVD